MAENLIIQGDSRSQRYETLVPQIRSLVEGERNLVANLANICAALRQTFGFFWVGFYLIEDDQLVLGPFQGDIACTRIAHGKGVCGSAWAQARTFVVPDVDAFPGHIACSSQSKSEVVVPLIKDGTVRGVLDIDSDRLDDFTEEVDACYLEQIADIVTELL
ncbi:GAF domain-containing protein [Porphyromonas pogonae]|uniref:GAF domain-containing protein n=1 Tax=Porphyromonas pogonae TaxID=867595 RepID=UPI002E761296|nr:GAF domain-containing protein [Porphyromonas pogonae]